MRHAITITLLLTLGVACGQSDRAASNSAPAPAATAANTPLSPEQLGELGAQINRQPDRANELLTHHGLTAESFEKEIRKITEDPQASRRYATAYKRANA